MQETHENQFENNLEKTAFINLTKKEQEHRHHLQNKQQKINSSSYLIGQVLGFAYNTALLIFVYYLVKNEHKELAVKIFLINALLIIIGLSLVTFGKKSPPKKSYGRNNHNRNQKAPTRSKPR